MTDDDRVPSWVYMADVPPPADPDPVSTHERELRAWSRAVAVWCLILAALLVLVATKVGRP